jgi:DHA3 family macrolide efflux protein-like MFS transporter
METTQPQAPGRRWVASFFPIWIGQAFSLIGSMLAQFALVWWLTETTGSATVLATATLAAILPGVLIGPFAGALVDRWNRKRVMMWADGAAALCALVLAALFWTHAIQPWHVYVMMLLRSVAGTFHWPAMQASTSLMVPKEHLSRVAGLNQTLHGVFNVVAPPLGALLLSIMPMQAIMGVDVITAITAIVPLFFVLIPQPPRSLAAGAPAGQGATVLQDVREGLRYVYHWPGVMTMMIMAAVINFLLNPAFSLMPILITKHFGGQALQLGWIDATWGAGVVLGGLTLSVWGGFRRRIVTTLVGLIGMGVGTLLIGLTPAALFGMALVGMFVAGFMNPITNGPVFAILQSVVAPDMQGRVFTVMGSLTAAMSPLGMIIAGPVADALGVRVWYVLGGVACILMGIAAASIPAVVHLEDHHRDIRVAAETAQPATASMGAPAVSPNE